MKFKYTGSGMKRLYDVNGMSVVVSHGDEFTMKQKPKCEDIEEVVAKPKIRRKKNGSSR